MLLEFIICDVARGVAAQCPTTSKLYSSQNGYTHLRGYAVTWQAATWLHSYASICLRGYAAVRLSGYVAMRLRDFAATRLQGYAPIRLISYIVTCLLATRLLGKRLRGCAATRLR